MPSQFFQCRSQPLVFGHRGVQTRYQENTMAGFEAAIALGLDGVELDTTLTKDGKLIVFHDLYTKRLTGVTGKITEMTWAEIQQLRIQRDLKVGKVGNKIRHYQTTAPIPLLEEVLSLLTPKILVNIEMKATQLNWQQYQIGVAVGKLIRQLNLEKQVFVTSFNPWSLISLKLNYPELESGMIYSRLTFKNRFLRRLMMSHMVERLLDSRMISLEKKLVRPKILQRLQGKDLAVGAWTLFPTKNYPYQGKGDRREAELVQRLIDQGADYLITDDPARVQKLITPASTPPKAPPLNGDRHPENNIPGGTC